MIDTMELLTRQEVAKLLRVDPRTVERWLRSGKLNGYKLGDGKTAPWRIDEAEVQKFLEKNNGRRI
jgi:excisionase family DNA binding protein